MQKKCTKCGILKDFSEFHKSKKTKDKLTHYCKYCGNEQSNNRYYKDKDYTMDEHLKTKFGITLKEYNKMVEDQDNKCAICKKEEYRLTKYGKQKRLAVDHDHETGVNRGLLCQNCNTGLGSFKDDVKSLQNAINYLVKHQKINVI